MCSDKTKNVPYVESVPYKLAETCRISELMARNYYKDFVIGEECLLDLEFYLILFQILIYLKAIFQNWFIKVKPM